MYMPSLFLPGTEDKQPAVLCGLLLNSFIFYLGLTPTVVSLAVFYCCCFRVSFSGMFEHLPRGWGVEGGKD